MQPSPSNLPATASKAHPLLSGEIPSYTLAHIPNDRRPSPSTVCEQCPASIWMAAPLEVKCYCRVMHIIVWKTSEPHQLTECDGLIMALAAQEAARQKAAEKEAGA